MRLVKYKILFLVGIIGLILNSNVSQGQMDDYENEEDEPMQQVSTPGEMMKSEDKLMANPSIALRSGVADTDLSHYDAGWGYGIELGFRPKDLYSYAFELGGHVNKSNQEAPTLTRTKLLGKGLFTTGGNLAVLKYTYIGAALGVIWDNLDNEVATEAGIAPIAGIDVPLLGDAKKLSLGGDVNYLFVSGNKPETFEVNGAVKYHF